MPFELGPGMGLMRLSAPGVEEAWALRVVHEALDRGVRFFDTADVYAPSATEVGHNERLLARALAGRSDEVVVATKGGIRRHGKKWIPDGRAKHLKSACEASLRALGVDCIDLYQLHAPDPKVPLATSLRALAALQRAGKVRDVGLCNVRLEDIEVAENIVDLASVQVALSPLDCTPLKNGVADYCAARGIHLVAHSPFGGHRRARRVAKLPVLQAIAKRHGVTPYEVVLQWLLRLGTVPIPGATRGETLASCLHALQVKLSEEDVAELDRAFPAGRRSPRRTPDPAKGEIVLFVGYPGAGKSTAAQSWVERGYQRLNRDERGGSLADLLPEVERHLTAGETRLVLDNTYPKRAARFDVIETASKHGVPVRCVWLQTTLEEAQVNAVKRMLSRYGRLPTPEDIRDSADPNTFSPEAQFRYRRELEPPRPEEGFVAIETIPFVRRRETARSGKAVFVEYEDARRTDVLARYRADGYRLFCVTYRPGAEESRARADFREMTKGLDIELHYCPHEPGPAVCWCRKPLPGLGVLLIEKYALDPKQCIVVGDSGADRGFAERVGCRLVSSEDFFGGDS